MAKGRTPEGVNGPIPRSTSLRGARIYNGGSGVPKPPGALTLATPLIRGESFCGAADTPAAKPPSCAR